MEVKDIQGLLSQIVTLVKKNCKVSRQYLIPLYIYLFHTIYFDINKTSLSNILVCPNFQ